MTREKYRLIEEKKRQIAEYGRAAGCASSKLMGFLLSSPDNVFYEDFKAEHLDLSDDEIIELCNAEIDELEHQITEIRIKDKTAVFTVVLTGAVNYDNNRSLVCKHVAKIDSYKYPWNWQKQAWVQEYYNDLVDQFIGQGATRLPDISKVKCEFLVNGYLECMAANWE